MDDIEFEINNFLEIINDFKKIIEIDNDKFNNNLNFCKILLEKIMIEYHTVCTEIYSK